MYSSLFGLISTIHPLTHQIEATLSGLLQKDNLPKKTLLLKEGDISDRLYFIEKGMARAFYFKNEQEITSWFMQENDLILSVYSFFRQKPSYENIELLEDSVLIYIQYSDLQQMYKEFPEFNFFGRVLTENYYVRSEERTISLRRLTSQDRYHSLLKSYPGRNSHGKGQSSNESISKSLQEKYLVRPQDVTSLKVGEFVGMTVESKAPYFWSTIQVKNQKGKNFILPPFATGVEAERNFERIKMEVALIIGQYKKRDVKQSKLRQHL